MVTSQGAAPPQVSVMSSLELVSYRLGSLSPRTALPESSDVVPLRQGQ